MRKRALTREELESIGLSPNEIEKALSIQKQKRERKYKYIVFLTSSEAEDLAKETGKKFIRASDYKPRSKK